MKTIHAPGTKQTMQRLKSKSFLFAFTLATIINISPSSDIHNNDHLLACHAAEKRAPVLNLTGNPRQETEPAGNPFNLNLSGNAASPREIYRQLFRSIDQVDHYVCKSKSINQHKIV